MKHVVVSAHTVAIDAHIIRGRLEADGIPAFIQDDQYITMDWMMSHALGGVKVSVPDSHYDQALEVLKNTQDDAYQLSQLDENDLSTELADSYIPEQPLHCPDCQSDHVSRLDWSQNFSLIVLFFLHTPLAFTKQHYACNDCDNVFAPEKNNVERLLLIVATVFSILLAILVVFTFALSISPHYVSSSTYLSAGGGDLFIPVTEADSGEWPEEEWSEVE